MNKKARQRGISMVITLVMLVLVTLMAISVMNTSLFEERMAGNTRDRQLAFEGAEYAVREAEDFLSGTVLPPFDTSGGSTGAYYSGEPAGLSGADERNYWANVHDWAGHSVPTTNSNGVVSGQSQPRYVVEEYASVSCDGYSLKWPPPAPRNVYRVTVRGTGKTSESAVILQAWYDRGCSQ